MDESMKKWKYKNFESFQSKYLGFTLIESMVVITVVGILATVSIPSYSNYVNSQKIQQSQQNIFSTLRQIRMQAVTQAQSVVMCSSVDHNICSYDSDPEDWSAGWIVFVDLNNNKQRDVKTEDILKLDSNNDNHIIKWNRGGYLTYNYEGKINQNGSFFVCGLTNTDQNLARSVIINRVGRAYLSKYTSNDEKIVC